MSEGGWDSIVADAYKVWKILTNICTDCLKSRQILEERNCAGIIVHHEKSGKENIRNLSLLPLRY